MKGFVAVFEREIVERRLLLVAALVLGLVPLLAPLLPGMPPARPAELRSGTALGIALVLTLALALLLGGSVIARDLAERRLGFYFARPLTGAAIWAGKMAAAAALTVGAGLLVLLPATLVGGPPDPSGYWGSTSSGVFRGGFSLVVIWVGILLLTLTATHAVSVMVRSRSPWLLLDLVALGVTSSVSGLCLLTLARKGAGLPVYWERIVSGPFGGGSTTVLLYVQLSISLVALLSLTVAGAAQVVRGRTDLRRGHRVLSIVLWSALLPASLLTAGYTRWFLAASLEDLVKVGTVVGAPAGPWMAVKGEAAHRGGYLPGFLYDAGSGRPVHVDFGLAYLNASPLVLFSADGGRAAWLETSDMRSPLQSDFELRTLDLHHPGASPLRSQVVLNGGVRAFALSPDGRRVAAVHGDRLTVYEISSGRLLAAVRRDRNEYHEDWRLVFAGPDRVRLYGLDFTFAPQRERSRLLLLRILDLDLTTGKATAIRTEDQLDGLSTWVVSPSADRALLRGQHTLQLRDGATGHLISELGREEARASFLPDGRIAMLTRGVEGSELRILDAAAGAELQRFRFPDLRTVIVADQPGPQTLRVVTRGAAGSAPWQLWNLNLASGESRLGPKLELTTLPLEGAGPWPLRRGGDGVVWLDFANARELVVLRDGLPGR